MHYAIAIIVYLGADAFSEYFFYKINRAAKFALRTEDRLRKRAKALMLICVAVLSPIYFAPLIFIARGILVDMCVSVAAGLHPLRITDSDRSPVDKLYKWAANKTSEAFVWTIRFILLAGSVALTAMY